MDLRVRSPKANRAILDLRSFMAAPLCDISILLISRNSLFKIGRTLLYEVPKFRFWFGLSVRNLMFNYGKIIAMKRNLLP